MEVDKIIKVLNECKQCQHVCDVEGTPACTNPDTTCFEAHCAAINYIEAAEEKAEEMRWHEIALEPYTEPDPRRLLLVQLDIGPLDHIKVAFYVPYRGRFYDTQDNCFIPSRVVTKWRYVDMEVDECV